MTLRRLTMTGDQFDLYLDRTDMIRGIFEALHWPLHRVGCGEDPNEIDWVSFMALVKHGKKLAEQLDSMDDAVTDEVKEETDA